MQHPEGVAVVATHPAALDRRALSQAWYSALHLAERGAPVRRRVATPSPGTPAKTPPAAPRLDGGNAAHVAAPRAVREGRFGSRLPRSDGQLTGAERRAPRSELAQRIERRIERALARRALDGGAAFAVRAGDARVHVVVRCSGARTRIVAVCSPPLRERVERALAQARFALAGRGAVEVA